MSNLIPTEHFLNNNSKIKILLIFSLLLNLNLYGQNLNNGGSIGYNSSICPGETPGTIDNLSYPSGGGSNPIEYLWMTTTNPSQPVSNWNIASGDNNQPSYSPGPFGITTYFIRCARREGFSEFAAESNIVTITVLTNPTANIIEDPGIISIGSTINFSASTSTNSTYSWDFDEDGIFDSFGQNQPYSFNTTGTFTVSLTVNNGSCSTTDFVTFTVSPSVLSILDPCTCDDPQNFSNVNGYFVHDFIQIKSSPNENWQIIQNNSGAIYNNSGTQIPVGTYINEVSNSPGEYVIDFWFKSGDGYNVDLYNGSDLLSSGTSDPCSCNVPLPVEMVSFDAFFNERNDEVIFNWTTSSESNNSHFALQRSLDGNQFDFLEVISGNGNSNLFHSYSLVDKNPVPGVNYYRLKQVDYDGSQTYSNIISVKIPTESVISSVIPNPINDHAIVRFGEKLPERTKLQILSATGQVMATYQVDNTFSHVINLEKFEKGIYFLRIKNAERKEKAFFKIVKL